jgi:N-acetylglucosamine kinase-like BadF-type ATPase
MLPDKLQHQPVPDLRLLVEGGVAGFGDYYNNRRYHKALGNVTPDDVLYGRREVKAQTLASRKRYNHLLRGSYNTATSP